MRSRPGKGGDPIGKTRSVVSAAASIAVSAAPAVQIAGTYIFKQVEQAAWRNLSGLH